MMTFYLWLMAIVTGIQTLLTRESLRAMMNEPGWSDPPFSGVRVVAGLLILFLVAFLFSVYLLVVHYTGKMPLCM